ncbi:c-type cytochrome [Aestuariivirga sp.]|uniref:c-type cytochrome n=1 Tax=Aestuariivirga sp. TaxID=2650926 RepID=UPI003918B637
MKTVTIAILAALALPAAALAQTESQTPPAAAPADQAAVQGDAAKGEKVFAKCKACHMADAETNRVGPHLKGLIGRNVAAVQNYKYSDAMHEFAKANPVWTEELFLTYIENPKQVVPGTKMVFPGLKKPEERADLLAYLKTKM